MGQDNNYDHPTVSHRYANYRIINRAKSTPTSADQYAFERLDGTDEMGIERWVRVDADKDSIGWLVYQLGKMADRIRAA